MKKTISIIIIIIIVVLGVFAAINIVSNSIQLFPYEYENTGNFEPNGDPNLNWNEKTKEYTIIQKFTTIDNKNYENITFKFEFYKNGKTIGNNTIFLNETKNSELTVKIKTNLSTEPDSFSFDVIGATEIF